MSLATFVTAICIPLIVLVAGVLIMRSLSGVGYRDQLRRELPKEDRKHLSVRYQGYDAAAVQRHWEPLVDDENAVIAESRFLRMDLLFPFFYCGAFAVSSLIVASQLEHTLMFLWMLPRDKPMSIS